MLCARSPVLGTEVNVETEDPLCATALAERDAGTGREPDAAGAAAEANKARGRRQPAVVQHRRVLHERHDGSAAAAPGHRVLVGINDVLYADPRVGQEPVRRPLLPLAGENHRQRSPRDARTRPRPSLTWRSRSSRAGKVWVRSVAASLAFSRSSLSG